MFRTDTPSSSSLACHLWSSQPCSAPWNLALPPLLLQPSLLLVLLLPLSMSFRESSSPFLWGLYSALLWVPFSSPSKLYLSVISSATTNSITFYMLMTHRFTSLFQTTSIQFKIASLSDTTHGCLAISSSLTWLKQSSSTSPSPPNPSPCRLSQSLEKHHLSACHSGP